MITNLNLKYVAMLFIVVLLSCFFHEFAHWLTGEMLGNRMSMSLNGAGPISGEYINEWNTNLVTIAGPVFTIIQAIAFYFILNRTKNIYLYPFLFFPFVYRFFAGLANILSANDEGRFGMSIGVGLFTISIIFCSFLLFLIYKSSAINRIGLKFNLITFLLCTISLAFIVFIDQYFHIKIFG